MNGVSSHKQLDLSANPILRHYYHNEWELGRFSVGLWNLILYLSAPLSLIKLGISVLQFYAACHNIAAIDMEERKAAKKNQK
ncbi:hypothetical protein KUTeg_010238 [Tegillarca granosa]|uniref:Uncharacterized protein n=1 Tax=Tegillarca granosa TaxID=220873 RepID=A0ABQ9F993_TEGGR|nr:hypothetical protein KUTeg_010238 [Tegillarca granosa]